jgi:site-specific DNA-methyltransferase (adenine-specific)
VPAPFDPDALPFKPYYSAEGFWLFHCGNQKIFPSIPEASVDLLFADPPYNLSNGGFTCHAGRRVPVKKGDWDVSRGVEADFAFHREWIRAARRVLKPHGSIWISGTYHSIYACGLALQLEGYHVLNEISWFKPNAAPNLSTRFFTASHETLIWARKNRDAKHVFNYEAMRMGKWPEDLLKRHGKQMRSVWSIPTPKPMEKRFGKHPTQKPFDLLKRIILASTKENDLVIDPFAGSSTTGLAAYLYGRKFIGIDTERVYLDLSIKRFEELKANMERKRKQRRIADWN